MTYEDATEERENSCHYRESNQAVRMTNGVKEAIVAYLKVLFRNLLGVTVKTSKYLNNDNALAENPTKELP